MGTIRKLTIRLDENLQAFEFFNYWLNCHLNQT